MGIYDESGVIEIAELREIMGKTNMPAEEQWFYGQTKWIPSIIIGVE